MGDFNAIMERKLDKSNMDHPRSEISLNLKKWMRDKGLIDCWRKHNTNILRIILSILTLIKAIPELITALPSFNRWCKSLKQRLTQEPYQIMLLFWSLGKRISGWEESNGNWIITYYLMRKLKRVLEQILIFSLILIKTQQIKPCCGKHSRHTFERFLLIRKPTLIGANKYCQGTASRHCYTRISTYDIRRRFCQEEARWRWCH